MARAGKADFSKLSEFIKQAESRFNEVQMTEWIESCAKELAARLLAKVIKRTPVGQYLPNADMTDEQLDYYDEHVKKNGGTLRRGWTGNKRQSAVSYAQSLPIHRAGDMYYITVENPVEYASYVEYGHRQTPGRYVPALGRRLKASWVPGQFMLTISEAEVNTQAPGILEKKLQKKLSEVFGK